MILNYCWFCMMKNIITSVEQTMEGGNQSPFVLDIPFLSGVWCTLFNKRFITSKKYEQLVADLKFYSYKIFNYF